MLSVCQQSADRNAKGVVLGIAFLVTFLPAPVQVVVVFTANSNSDASDIRVGSCVPYSGGGSAHTHAASRRVDTIILPLKTYILTIVAELTISDNLKRSVGYYLSGVTLAIC